MPAKAKVKHEAKSLADSQRQTDALYIMDSLMNLPKPITINVSEISARNGIKPNTIIKRFGVLRARYPGLNIVTTIKPAEAGSTPAATAPSTPGLASNKKNAGAKSKPVSKKTASQPTSRKTRQSISNEVEEPSEVEDDDDDSVDEEGDRDEGDKEIIDDEKTDEVAEPVNGKNKRKRPSAKTTTPTRQTKKAKVAAAALNGEDISDKLSSGGYVGNEQRISAVKKGNVVKMSKLDMKGEAEEEHDYEGTTPSLTSDLASTIQIPVKPLSIQHDPRSDPVPVPNAITTSDTEHGQKREQELSSISLPPSSLPPIDLKINGATITLPTTIPSSNITDILTSNTPLAPLILQQPQITADHSLLQKKKYDTFPPPPPSSKKNKILTFGGVPLLTAPLSEDTKAMVQSGELRNGVGVKNEVLASESEPGSGSKENDTGEDNDDDVRRLYEWQQC